jgi:Flp pilus assembly protein CpaB
VKRSNRLILLIGVLLAVVAFVGIIFVFNNQSGGTSQPVVTANVVVATKDIKLGEAVTDRMVGTKQIPLADKKTDQYSDPGEIIGQVVRTDVTSGAYMTQAMFAGTGSPNIGKDLPAGLVAVAVRVDALTGVGTLINAGDRVDVLVTLAITPVTVTPGQVLPDQAATPPQVTKQDALTGNSTKLLLQNMEVRGTIATVAAAADGTTATAVDPLTTQQIVILAVTPQQAEVIQFAQQQALTMPSALPNNNLTLILRSPKDKDASPVTTTGVVLDTLIKDYGVLPPGILEPTLPKQ